MGHDLSLAGQAGGEAQQPMGWRLCVREVAQTKGIDQEELARLATVSPDTLARIWQNPTADANLALLSQLARVLGCKLTDLLTDAEKPA